MTASQDPFRKLLRCFVPGGRTAKPLEVSGGKEDQEGLKKNPRRLAKKKSCFHPVKYSLVVGCIFCSHGFLWGVKKALESQA